MPNYPHILSIEFARVEDAEAARDLLLPMDFGRIRIEPKRKRFSPNADSTPRIRALEAAFASRRSFDIEMIAEALEKAGYSNNHHSAYDWINHATKAGVLRKVDTNTYEFIPKAERNSLQPQECENAR